MISSEQDSPSFPDSFDSWTGFTPGTWTESIKVRDFIQKNYTPYGGNEDFLSGPSSRTLQLWDHLKTLLTQEIDKGECWMQMKQLCLPSLHTDRAISPKIWK